MENKIPRSGSSVSHNEKIRWKDKKGWRGGGGEKRFTAIIADISELWALMS